MSFAAWTLKSTSHIILILKNLDAFFFKTARTSVILILRIVSKQQNHATTVSLNYLVLLLPVFPIILCFELLTKLYIFSL